MAIVSSFAANTKTSKQLLSSEMKNIPEERVDEILKKNDTPYTLFPIRHNLIWHYYKTAKACNWIFEEIVWDTDLHDWNNKLTDNERFYVKNILAFFANADGIVNENLVLRFRNDVQFVEAQFFYDFQMSIENVHAETYQQTIMLYIPSEEERTHLLNAIETVPCVKKKADWALRWINSDSASFGERLLAFACVEGIFFSGSFAAIFWLRKRGLLAGLSQANTLISRDEGLHQRFACMLYKDHLHYAKPSKERAEQIVREACEIEKEFQTESLPVSLIGMNHTLMSEYIEYVADFLLGMIGQDKIYHSKNPFDFMNMIAVDPVSNFFEKKSTEYTDAVVPRGFSVDEDF